MRWQDVDMEAETLTVRVQLQRIGGKLMLTEPKSERSRRLIMLPPMAVDALRRHKVRQLEERLAAGLAWVESRLVFTTALGTPLDARNVLRIFHVMLERAGLRSMPMHDLRHTCASLLLAQGAHPRFVMELLGHSQISMTMDTYSTVFPALKRDVADRIQAILTAEG